jgi:hypothetical protein
MRLQDALEQTRRTSERYLMVRCIDASAEIALEDGDAGRCRAYADELLAIAVTNGLRELEASARRWLGKAFLAQEACVEAEAELSRAAALAEEIGRVRLAMDAEAALARALGRLGRADAAREHGVKAHSIVEAIEKSLPGSGLEMRLRPTDGVAI